MRSFLTIAAASTIMIPIWSARSDEVPTLKVEQLCHGIVNQSSDPLEAGTRSVSFNECIQAEQEDREQTIKEWPTFSAADKKLCVAEVTAGGDSSYTDLITCLEMSRDVRSMRSEAASNVRKHKAKRGSM